VDHHGFQLTHKTLRTVDVYCGSRSIAVQLLHMPIPRCHAGFVTKAENMDVWTIRGFS
jgi:hypothetical protein